MNAFRRALRIILLPLAFAACERSSKPPRGDSSRAVPASSAVPVESALTVPLEETVATSSLSLDQVTVP